MTMRQGSCEVPKMPFIDRGVRTKGGGSGGPPGYGGLLAIVVYHELKHLNSNQYLTAGNGGLARDCGWLNDIESFVVCSNPCCRIL